ncbi:unnamed protein product [Cochlearia groenlandica]
MTWSLLRSINSPTLDISAAAIRSSRNPFVAAGLGFATIRGVSLLRMSSSSSSPPPPFASLSVSASSGNEVY